MVYDVLVSWNPWWDEGEVPRRFLGLPRDITGELYPRLEGQTIVSLLGVRRSGKTTVLYQLIQMLLDDGVLPANILFVDMEDPRLDGVNVGVADPLQTILYVVFAAFVLSNPPPEMQQVEIWRATNTSRA